MTKKNEKATITEKQVKDVKDCIDESQVKTDLAETDANAYPLEVKIAGYAVRHQNGKIEFIPKQKRKIVNGLVAVHQTDDTCIKTNKNYVQVMFTLKRETFNFKKYMSVLNEIYNNLKALKLL